MCLISIFFLFFLSQCVTPVLSCDGWHIVTIEGLGSTKEGLHPIQERLAAFHGTQCGFCTPGMVMQMNRLVKKRKPYFCLLDSYTLP